MSEPRLWDTIDDIKRRLEERAAAGEPAHEPITLTIPRAMLDGVWVHRDSDPPYFLKFSSTPI